jgi:hypothetical protein
LLYGKLSRQSNWSSQRLVVTIELFFQVGLVDDGLAQLARYCLLFSQETVSKEQAILYRFIPQLSPS